MNNETPYRTNAKTFTRHKKVMRMMFKGIWRKTIFPLIIVGCAAGMVLFVSVCIIGSYQNTYYNRTATFNDYSRGYEVSLIDRQAKADAREAELNNREREINIRIHTFEDYTRLFAGKVPNNSQLEFDKK